MDIFSPNPLKIQLIPAWDSRAVDLTWQASAKTSVVGYNVWRASDAPSNYSKITSSPIQAHFFRDITKVIAVVETPTAWLEPPDSATGLVAIRLSHFPMCKHDLDRDNRPILATPYDVRVSSIATGTLYQIERVEPHTGTIVCGIRPVLNDTFDGWSAVDNPDALTDIKVEYFYIDRFTDSSFGRDLYYIVNEVFADGTEADLSLYPAVSNLDLDPADMFWREAMRRNRFIFEQVGEPAYVLLRKTTGPLCGCVDIDTFKPRTQCMACWGVGFIGGYDGPYPMTFTPPNAPIQTKQAAEGRSRSRTAQSFLGPTPVLSAGDLIVRFNGERVIVTEVERTSVRGTSLQQTYTSELLKPSDFRNSITIVNPSYPLLTISTNAPAPRNTDNPFGDPIPSIISLQEGVSSQMISDPTQDVTKSENIHPEDDLRTNTVPSVSPVFENWSF